VFEQCLCDLGDIACQHHRTADAFYRRARSFGQSFHHHGFERSLAQFAHKQRDQELLLRLRGAGKQLMQQFEALLLRPTAGGRDDGVDCAIDLGNLQARRGGRGSTCIAQRRISDADAPLPDGPGQKRHHDVDFPRMKFGEKAREQINLFETLGCSGNALRGLHHLRQEHVLKHSENGMVTPCEF